MKVILLGDPSSSHIVKWANGIHSRGIDVLIFGLYNFDPSQYSKGIKVEFFKSPKFVKWRSDGNILKSLYLLSLPKLHKVIKDFKSDLMHTQYASSYGMLAALSGFHPSLLQVWGADVYRFPDKSKFHENLLRYNLRKADTLLSTSHSMLLRTKKYTDKNIEFIQLGVDINKFIPMKVDSLFKPDDIVIGTIKSLEKQYGIDLLIKSFKKVKDNFPSLPLKLLIVGQGTLENYLKKLVQELNIENDTIFTGQIPHSEVPRYHNMLDVYVALSVEDSETFGVAVIEASACEKPVVVSNVGGLPEAVEHNLSGFIVENLNIDQAAKAISKLVEDKNLRKQMGSDGRKRVVQNFNWEDKVDQMVSLYKRIV